MKDPDPRLGVLLNGSTSQEGNEPVYTYGAEPVFSGLFFRSRLLNDQYLLGLKSSYMGNAWTNLWERRKQQDD